MRDARTTVRESLAERQRELALRVEVLGREHPGSGRHDDLLERVFDATDDLMRVVDEAHARSLRRRRLLATALAATALVGVVLVAAGMLPAAVLLAAGLALGGAVALWLTAYPGRSRTVRFGPPASESTAPHLGAPQSGASQPGALKSDAPQPDESPRRGSEVPGPRTGSEASARAAAPVPRLAVADAATPTPRIDDAPAPLAGADAPRPGAETR